MIEDNDNNIIWVGIGIVSFLLFCISIYSIFNNWYEIKLSYFGDVNSFSKTTGTIQDAGIATAYIRRSGIYYYPNVAYSYNVNNVQYKSERISFKRVRFDKYGLAESYLRRFPIKGKVQVYFDPDNPGDSVLDPNGRNYFVLEFVGVLSFPLLIIAFIVRRYLKSKYKQAGEILEENLDTLIDEEESNSTIR